MAFDVRRLDVYRKVPKDLTQPTLTGALISITSLALILFLFGSELIHFLSPEITSDLFVDQNSAQDRIPVRLNVSLPRLSCSDENGRHEVGFVDNTAKTELTNGQGCRFEANFFINKVPGNFHVSTHAAKAQPQNIDMSHVIHEVTFGDPTDHFLATNFGSFNVLRDNDKSAAKALESHEYHLKIVPTICEDSRGERRNSFQYTSAYKSDVQFTHHGVAIPAIWFRYDLTPITVKYSVKRKPFYTFVTTVLAIVGGTFTVAGIIDSLLFSASEVFRKWELGKLS